MLVAAAAAAAGCGGSSSGSTSAAATTSAAPLFAPGRVEKMIRRSVEPTLAANLGEGARMTVNCRTTGSATLTCDTVLIPADPTTERIKVVYGVTCTTSTCRWQPIG